eukprot:13390673-Heterocapsa_arctica.AAC.1
MHSRHTSRLPSSNRDSAERSLNHEYMKAHTSVEDEGVRTNGICRGAGAIPQVYAWPPTRYSTGDRHAYTLSRRTKPSA